MKNSISVCKEKELVKVRIKPLYSGSGSVYLEYHKDGQRIKEYLKMYIIPERSKLDKIKNEETMNLAKAIQAKRIIEMQQNSFGFRRYTGDKVLLTDYMDQREQHYLKLGKTSYAGIVRRTKQKCIDYAGTNVTLARASRKEYQLGFIDYLNGTTLGDGTIYTYYNSLLIVLNTAVRERIIQENESRYIDSIDKPKQQESTRAYLTLDEVQKLANTPCKYDMLKRAFMFSCFSGLRISDINRLNWEQIVTANDGSLQVDMTTKKTKEVVYLPLSPNAAKWLPERGAGQVFVGLPGSPTRDRILVKWAHDAGIEKHITFHCSRHTVATLLLEYGADIYTVQKILGQRNIQTTMRYAKMVDHKKREAVNAIPKIK